MHLSTMRKKERNFVIRSAMEKNKKFANVSKVTNCFMLLFYDGIDSYRNLA